MLNLLKRRLKHTLLILGSFKGNARGCLLTEPMWGIPYNLYIAYASLYMRALGCSTTQIGLIASVGLLSETFFSLIGGHITDRLGRRRTTLIFDLISWSIPTLIWAFAQGYFYFLIAAIINSIVRIVFTSWTCLLVEDTRPRQRVHVFTWIRVAGALAGFFAPLAGIVVSKIGLVPAVRGLYGFAFVSMTSMFLIRNHLTHETAMGYRKMLESKDRKIREVFGEYREIFALLRKKPQTFVAFVILLLASVQLLYSRTFLPILLREGLEFPLGVIALIPAVASAVKMTIYVFVMPGLGRLSTTKGLTIGVSFSALGIGLLIIAPVSGVAVALVAILLEAVGAAITNPFADALLANAIDDHQRAKVVSLFHTFMNGLMSPFGYLGGVLATLTPRAPFGLVLGAIGLQFVLIRILKSVGSKSS